MMSDGTPTPGVFISLEGIDGSGKSTQAALLVAWLRAQGHDVVATREPGGTPLGAELRRLLLGLKQDANESGDSVAHETARAEADAAVSVDAEGRAPAPVAEMLLMAADRAQHVARLIRPALAAGKIVVSDRFVDSSMAYQGVALGLPEEDVARVNDIATGGLRPDLTILFDLDPARAHARDGEPQDRIEQRGLQFQQRVREAYHGLARREPARWVTLSVDGMSIEEVHALVVRTVQERFAIFAQDDSERETGS